MSITIQSTYLTDYVKGFPGMIADQTVHNQVSGTVEDSAGIAFGLAAFQGTNDRGITATPGTKFRGIAVANAGIVAGTVSGAADTYPQYASASLLDMGDIWVTAGHAVVAGEAVYVTSGGVFTDVSSSNTAIPATFLDTAASGAPARIRVVQQ